MKNSLKILHIVGSLNIGGVQKLIIELFKTNVFRGLKKNILCTISDYGTMRNEFEKSSFKIFVLPNLLFCKNINDVV